MVVLECSEGYLRKQKSNNSSARRRYVSAGGSTGATNMQLVGTSPGAAVG